MIIHSINDRARGLDLTSIPRDFVRIGGDTRRGGPQISERAMFGALVENNTLRVDQTREIDATVTRVARRDLVAVSDLAALLDALD